MANVRVAITLDEEILAEAYARAGGGGLSAFVNQVLADHFQRLRILEYLREQEKAHGPLPPETREAALREVSGWFHEG
jgi:Arc/MetJ family transcription regulator